MQIKLLKNNLMDLLDKYCEQTGATKTWIAKQLEVSPQRLYQLCKADNMNIDIAYKLAEFLKCDVRDLFDYQIIQ